MDYGHSLEFGISIPPVSADPDTVIALARHGEVLGYDAVIVQGHPHQGEFLDTWTLASWVAGRTEHIRIMVSITDVSLRSPAVLARSAASLDLLSAGRFQMALETAEDRDEITSMGGVPPTPPEGIDMLSEGIDIIRGILDVAAGGRLSYHGNYHRLQGAERGPVPAHDIPLLVRTVNPHMLRVAGRKADGWLSSIRRMKPGELQTANEVIDAAALEVGRDPREIRRVVNIVGRFSASRHGFLDGPSEQWVEDLLPLVLNDGVGTFMLVSDDVQVIEQFARDVVPALREAVNRARPEGASVSRMRRTAVRAKRRAGIDYDGVPASLADAVIEPGDVGYARVKSTYMRGGAPGLVIRTKNTGDVVEALGFARAHPGLPLAVRSGGHGISGRSTNNGGIVIDLSGMNGIEVIDQATRRVRIEPGARWMDVAAALAPYGWALSSGDYGGVGVGGLATAGGVGWLARKHGLTIDHLRAVEMVLADGSVVRADNNENAELFWAVRGAGANFGIVTSFEFEVYEVGAVGWAQLVFDAQDTATFLERWGAEVEAAPRDLTSFVILGPPRRGQPVIAQVMAVVDSDDPDTIIGQLQPFADIAPMYGQNVVITSYADIMTNAQGGEHNGQGEPVARSGLIEHITPEFAAAAEQLIHSGAVYFFQIRSVGGAVSDVAPDATAYANRAANFSVTAIGSNRERVNHQWDQLYHHFEGLYLSFETDLRPERLADAFPPATLAHLRALKSRYDPRNVFRDNFNIAPVPVGADVSLAVSRA